MLVMISSCGVCVCAWGEPSTLSLYVQTRIREVISMSKEEVTNCLNIEKYIYSLYLTHCDISLCHGFSLVCELSQLIGANVRSINNHLKPFVIHVLSEVLCSKENTL